MSASQPRGVGRRRFLRWHYLAVPLAFIVCLELAARIVSPVPEYIEQRPFDPYLGFRSPPGFSSRILDERGEFEFRLNSLGFRGAELPRAGPSSPPRQRILFVGDSFLIGWGVREQSMIPAVSVRELAGRGVPAEAIGIAGDGYGTAQELLLLRRHVGELRPDIVVLCFFTGNDFADNSIDLVGRTRGSPAYVRPYLIPNSKGELEATWVHPGRARLRRWSRVAQLAELRLLGLGWIDSGEPAHGALVTDASRIEAGLLPRGYMNLFVSRPESPWETAWATSFDLLTHFGDEVWGAGARFVVVVIPHKFQVQRDAEFRGLEAQVAAAGLEPLISRLDWNLPEQRLEESLEAAGIDTVLLLEPLRQETERTARSMFQLGHLNHLGHQVAGRAIAEALVASVDDRPTSAQVDPGEPVDLPELVLQRTSRFDFASEPRRELFGRGWHSWSADWWGEVRGWAMSSRGELLIPNRRGELILRGWLPEGADLPAGLQVDRVSHRIATSGDFEVRQWHRPVRNGTSTHRIVVRLPAVVPLWQDVRGRRCSLILKSLELQDRKPEGHTAP